MTTIRGPPKKVGGAKKTTRTPTLVSRAEIEAGVEPRVVFIFIKIF